MIKQVNKNSDNEPAKRPITNPTQLMMQQGAIHESGALKAN